MDTVVPEFIQASQLPDYQGDNAVLLDIRDEASFRNNHLPDAQWMMPEALVENIETMDVNKHYIIICYHGISAVPVANYMKQRGFQTSVLQNGMAAFARF